jgi:hypothetical protein
MKDQEELDVVDSGVDPGNLPGPVPFIWPEARVLAGLTAYKVTPPANEIFANADLISGLLVGAADGTVRWLRELCRMEMPRSLSLVVALAPAGPTRETHLRALLDLQEAFGSGNRKITVRLLPLASEHTGDTGRPVSPPTVLLAHQSNSGRTVMTVGSVGDGGHDPYSLASVNLVFEPDDSLRDAWRRWFQFVLSNAAPLTDATARIPQLVPAAGDPEAADLWRSFTAACWPEPPPVPVEPTVEPVTGEVLTDGKGHEVKPWDDGVTRLDPLARVFQKVYADGWLVTVDEATRIKPLSVPVKATLLGQEAERSVGALTQKQSFTLQVLEDDLERSVEKCRKVTDIIELLSFRLSHGNRWLPEAARPLLERELEARNESGKKMLAAAMGTTDVDGFVEERTDTIRKNLDGMYRDLHQGDSVPSDRLQAVLDIVRLRLQQALKQRITPRTVYNRIAAPNLTSTAPDENWNQPLLLLVGAARALRESLTDPYFHRRFVGLSFSIEAFQAACNPIGDSVVGEGDARRARQELAQIAEILATEERSQEKCLKILRLVRGGQG